jgi:hypothetical protein
MRHFNYLVGVATGEFDLDDHAEASNFFLNSSFVDPDNRA